MVEVDEGEEEAAAATQPVGGDGDAMMKERKLRHQKKTQPASQPASPLREPRQKADEKKFRKDLLRNHQTSISWGRGNIALNVADNQDGGDLI